jgi:murein DD-endopeptidase MepM/ murein hydrolase activator NlpD
LFERREFNRGHAAHFGGTAALTLDRPYTPLLLENQLLNQVGSKLHGFNPVVNLAHAIGTGRWWRGLATCAGLCVTATLFTPGFAPLPSQADTTMTPENWQEWRSQSINALAYGADTGSRMGETDRVERLTNSPERPSVDLTAALGQGDGFSRALQRSGVASAEAEQVARMVANIIALDQIPEGSQLAITLGRRPSPNAARPLSELKLRASLGLALAIERNPGGPLRLRRIPIAIDATPLRVQGAVGSSLYRSARAAGASAQAITTYLRAIGRHVPIYSIPADAKFDLVIEQRRAATGEVELGDLRYAAIVQEGKRIELLRWTLDGQEQWFEPSGVGQSRGAMQRPVAVARVTSGFGFRIHPLLGYSRFHKGIDFGAPSGTPIVAAADGIVKMAGWSGGYGNFVKLDHAGGIGTGYGHMSRIIARSGQRVRQGELIGYVGSTGLSTGPHLHYEMYRNGVAVDPRSVKFVTQAKLSGSALTSFRATLARMKAVPVGAPMRRPAQIANDIPALPKS